jgi:TolB protein
MSISRSSAFAWLALFVSAAVSAAPLGVFEDHADIGKPKLAGDATWNAASQEYVLTSGGVNMWEKRDEFHLAWRKLQGDFILQARVEFLGKGVDPHRKAGLIVRSSLDDDSPYVDGALHAGDGLTSLQFRRARGALTEQLEAAVKGADVVQLERRGNTYIFSAARFGEPFVTREIAQLDLGDSVYAGLFLCSHNGDVKETAVFRNVRVIRPAKPDFVPYRDYIGSVLELLDVETGVRQVVRHSKEPFEAPNWTPDGTALIYNTSGRVEGRGRLYRFDLATRQAALIDTGFAIRNNNDHVLSFDGTQLAISGNLEQSQSTIFTMSVKGGVTRKITPNTPSYMHGWTPDAKWLVYTGGRIPKGKKDNEYDIYKIASDGSGKEINLTNSAGLDDGPEVSPDGKWIYFNSTRSGQMQIWRMGLDGKNVERVTNDHKWNDWFPHFSPDGKWITIISYGLDVPAADHPYYKHCMIRIMPTDGSAPPKVIAYVYGGQGTINVPSWSPDGTHIAFVSNSDAL